MTTSNVPAVYEGVIAGSIVEIKEAPDIVLYSGNHIDAGHKRASYWDAFDYGMAGADIVSFGSTTRTNPYFVLGSAMMPSLVSRSSEEFAAKVFLAAAAAHVPGRAEAAIGEIKLEVERLSRMMSGVCDRLERTSNEALAIDPTTLARALSGLTPENSHSEDWEDILQQASDVDDKPASFFEAARLALRSRNAHVRAAAAQLLGYSDDKADLDAIRRAMAKEDQRFVRAILASAERALSL